MLYPDVTWGKKALSLSAGSAIAPAPGVLLTFMAARVPCSLVFSLLSAKTFAAELLPSHPDPILYPCLAHPSQVQGSAFICAETHEGPVGIVLQAAEQISATDAEALTLTLAVAWEPLSIQQINGIKILIGYSLKPDCIFLFLIVDFRSTT